MPLNRLRHIAYLVQNGKLKDIAISGRDEVATLARSLKTFFMHKEELNHKKSSKIFEIRNVLRSVLSRVDDAVFIVDDNSRVNYTNDAAALLFGLASHHMEGKNIHDCMYSPSLKKSIEGAFAGDIPEEALLINMEITNGRIHDIEVKIGLVRNRDGEVSRVVVVFCSTQIKVKTKSKVKEREKDIVGSWGWYWPRSNGAC